MKFIKLKTEDNIELNGFHYASPHAEQVVIHVHGSCGNFYENPFIHELGRELLKQNVDLVTVSLRTANCIAEAYGDGWMGYLGGSIASFETCVQDIEAIIEYAKDVSPKIILQGHSLGCDRIVTFCQEREFSGSVILLSPCDSYNLHKEKIHPETMSEFLLRLEGIEPQHKFDLLPPNYYGIRENGMCYDIPITKQALLSIIKGPPFSVFRIASPDDYFIDTDCLAIIGGKDGLQTSSPNSMFKLLASRFRTLSTTVIPDSDHDFFGSEPSLVSAVTTFIANK